MEYIFGLCILYIFSCFLLFSFVYSLPLYILYILLELLTGKVVVPVNGGVNLVMWVHSVVREEWTVFDKSLLAEGASKERMLNWLFSSPHPVSVTSECCSSKKCFARTQYLRRLSARYSVLQLQ